jgi:nitrous oxidase accessory protein NosD
MIGKRNKKRNGVNNEVILVARLLEEHGYEIRAVRQGGKGGVLTVKALPPILSGVRQTDCGTELPDPKV